LDREKYVYTSEGFTVMKLFLRRTKDRRNKREAWVFAYKDFLRMLLEEREETREE